MSMSSSLPVTIIGGYLGSGKTTLINQILNTADGIRYAVLVNDFGELAIDSHLIESQEGDVINLSGGCVCCSYGNDLTTALMTLDKQAFDQVVIESSGVALPGAIAGTLSLLVDFFLGAIVVLADASTVQAQAADKYLADTIDRQLASADIIVLNKTDLASDEELQQTSQWLEQRYPGNRLIQISKGNYPEGLFAMGSHADTCEITRHFADDEHQTSIYTSFIVNANGGVDAAALAESLADKACGLLRAKGFVENIDSTLKTIQVVGSRWTVSDAPEGVTPGIVCIGLAALCVEDHVRAKFKRANFECSAQ